MKKFLLFFPFLLLISCGRQKEAADLILHNAIIYSVDSSFTVYEAMAVKDGKILELNTNEKILEGYEAKEKKDAGGKAVFPGFIDAHCHFLSYGLGLQQVDLVGTKSFEEVVQRVADFAEKNKPTKEELDKMPRSSGPQLKQLQEKWIVGRGWDQNDWREKEYPNRKKLDSLFPNTPVILKRIDGHAALANGEALRRAGIYVWTEVKGGEIEKEKREIPEIKFITLPGKKNNSKKINASSASGCLASYPGAGLTGILIDNAVDLVTGKIPPPSKEKLFGALLQAQEKCFAMGLTTVDDAGLMKYEIDAIDELQKKGDLKMRVYAMLSDSTPNYKYYLEKGPYKTERLNVRSFKFYGDGALGSRGACLLQNYSDKPGWKGFLLNTKEHYDKYAGIMDEESFQMNTHCIGDSAMRLILLTYLINPRIGFDLKGDLIEDIAFKRRWRIEHCQVIDKNDFEWMKKLSVIPSIQPTHATSDMYWAAERLGKERVKYAYAYKDLLKAAGLVALGTDFPVEDISPFKTFYAAVYRKDSKGFPEGGFQMENALTREETIKGMTIWAAYSNFEEKEKGSLEKGKFADFIILDTDLMKCAENEILKAGVLETYLNGEKVYLKKQQATVPN